MRPLQGRERALLWALAVAAPCALFWSLVYAPSVDRMARIERDITARRAELALLRARAGQETALRRQLEEAQRRVQEAEALLPTARDIPDLLVQLDTLARTSGVDLARVAPGPLEPLSPPGGGRSQAPSSGGSTAAAARARGASSAPPAQGVDRFPVDLVVRGSFPHITRFVAGIETFPRYLAVTGYRLAPAPQPGRESSGAPLLELQLHAAAYVIEPGTAGMEEP
jgi:Tfp pilus assembly protein PilO